MGASFNLLWEAVMDLFKTTLLTTSALCIAAIVSTNYSIVPQAHASGGIEKPYKGGTKARKKKARKAVKKRAVRKRPAAKKRPVKRRAKRKVPRRKKPTKAETAAYQAYKESVQKRITNLTRVGKKLFAQLKASRAVIEKLKAEGKDNPDNWAYSFHQRRIAIVSYLLRPLSEEVWKLGIERQGLVKFKRVNKKPLDPLFQFDRKAVQTFIRAYQRDLKAHQAAGSPQFVIDEFKRLIKHLQETDLKFKTFNETIRSLAN